MPVGHVLVLEDDESILKTLQLLLHEEGYMTFVARSPDEALALLDTTPVQCVLADLFGASPTQLIASAEVVRQRALPIPVGILTAHTLPHDHPDLAPFAFVLTKPFDIDDLLSHIAASINTPLDDTQRAQQTVIERYFAALSDRDWDALIALCTDDVTYALPGESPHATVIMGKAAFRAYTEEVFRSFFDARFTDITIYPTPTGLAARYLGSWRTSEGADASLAGGVRFRFRGDLIAQIGIHLNAAGLSQE
jgi:CheY-like chemotaxis protein